MKELVATYVIVLWRLRVHERYSSRYMTSSLAFSVALKIISKFGENNA